MHSEPPRAATKKKSVVPKFVEREIDRAYAGLDSEERQRFMRMARGEIRRCLRRVRWANEAAARIEAKRAKQERDTPDEQAPDEPLLESVRSVSEAVDKLVGSYERLDGMCHRAYQRVEPFVKMAAKMQEEQTPTVTVLVGQLATSPAMKMLVGAEKQVVEAPAERPDSDRSK